MSKVIVTSDLAAKGMKVVRGKYWMYGEQDLHKGVPSVGTIMEDEYRGHVLVKWENGYVYQYRVGAQGAYDLYMYDPFTTFAQTPQGVASQMLKVNKVDQMRQALQQSIAKPQELKSNNNYGTTRDNTTGKPDPIKVRPAVSTIKGAKRRSSTPVRRGRS